MSDFSIVVEDPDECKPIRFVTVSGDPNTPYLGFRVVINLQLGLFLQLELPQVVLIPGQDDLLAWLKAHARALRIAAEPMAEKWLDPNYVEVSPEKFRSDTFKKVV
jgi:hypothetical protein